MDVEDMSNSRMRKLNGLRRLCRQNKPHTQTYN